MGLFTSPGTSPVNAVQSTNDNRRQPGASNAASNTTPATGQPPRLLDRLADALHQRHSIPALIHDYVDWARRYIFYHNRQHPDQLGMAEVTAFLQAREPACHAPFRRR